MQDGQLMKNISLGTSTKKMRKNFSNLKVEWQSITDNIKRKVKCSQQQALARLAVNQTMLSLRK